MTTESLAHLFDRSRREGNGWRARCPVHKSKGLTLGIYPKDDRSILVCYAGCKLDDILATVGLTWKDTLYQQIDPKAWREDQRKREIQEKRARDLRIGVWILRFIENGYTLEDHQDDVTLLCACAIALTNKPDRTWERLLRISTERIAAAEHVMERRMMPAVAKPRYPFPGRAFDAMMESIPTRSRRY